MSAANSNPNQSVLKQAREAKGLTLDIVHEATKVPLDVLKAIEEGYTVRSMTPFYYRGFIKIYAEFLGLDVKEVQGSYGLGPAAKKELGVSAPIASPKKSLKAKQSPNYAKEQAQEWLSTVLTAKNFFNILKFVAVLAVLFLCVRMAGCMIQGIQSKLKEKPRAGSPVKVEKKLPIKKQEKAPLPAVVVPVGGQQSSEIKAESSDHKVRLVVRAVKDSAIQVKADGKVVFQMTMKKGTVESWDADREILLSGKNINELDLEVNGSHLGALGSDQRRARKVRITKEGLTVNK